MLPKVYLHQFKARKLARLQIDRPKFHRSFLGNTDAAFL